jgi:DeoR/GlpR family transcriptional regulator of sugar metabolism
MGDNQHGDLDVTEDDRLSMARGPYITKKKDQQNESKEKIAEYIASNLVKDFDAVLLDAGSTAEVIAQKLFTARKFLTVLTTNMGAYVSYTQAVAAREERGASQLVAGLLNENELILTGGRFDVTYEALFGDATLDAIRAFSPNVTIIGVSGLLFNGGVFCHGSEEVRVKKMLWTTQTDIRVIASDWTKVGKRDAFAFGPQVSQLKVGAEKAVVVTSQPPRDASSELRKKFDEEIQLLKGIDIPIVVVE